MKGSAFIHLFSYPVDLIHVIQFLQYTASLLKSTRKPAHYSDCMLTWISTHCARPAAKGGLEGSYPCPCSAINPTLPRGPGSIDLPAAKNSPPLCTSPLGRTQAASKANLSRTLSNLAGDSARLLPLKGPFVPFAAGRRSTLRVRPRHRTPQHFRLHFLARALYFCCSFKENLRRKLIGFATSPLTGKILH